MPQPKSRKIAILGYRSVGESACMTSSFWKISSECSDATLALNVGGLFALVWSVWFTPTLIVGSRFSSGETWPGRFILPEAVRDEAKADFFFFLHFLPVRLPSATSALPNQRLLLAKAWAWLHLTHYCPLIWSRAKAEKRSSVELKVRSWRQDGTRWWRSWRPRQHTSTKPLQCSVKSI